MFGVLRLGPGISGFGFTIGANVGFSDWGFGGYEASELYGFSSSFLNIAVTVLSPYLPPL